MPPLLGLQVLTLLHIPVPISILVGPKACSGRCLKIGFPKMDWVLRIKTKLIYIYIYINKYVYKLGYTSFWDLLWMVKSLFPYIIIHPLPTKINMIMRLSSYPLGDLLELLLLVAIAESRRDNCLGHCPKRWLLSSNGKF